MFKLTRPCANCPFRKGQGELFGLHPERLEAMLAGTAFQCHKTIDYDHTRLTEDGEEKPSPGDHPQQCAGLMSLLHRSGQPNQIMQVAQRLTGYDPGKLDHADVYETIDDLFIAHTGGKRCRRSNARYRRGS